MSNELSISVSISLVKNGAMVSRSHGFSADLSGEAFVHAVQSIGFGSAEVLQETSEVGTPRWVYVKNLDDTNFLTFGSNASMDLKLLAGEAVVYRTNIVPIYAQADTASVDVEYIIIES